MTSNFEDLALWSLSRLQNELNSGLNPNTCVNQFLQVRLVHYWARMGELEHLKLLHRAQADFTLRTRYGETARDELIRCWNRSAHEKYAQCLNWFSREIPDTPPATPSSSPATSFVLSSQSISI